MIRRTGVTRTVLPLRAPYCEHRPTLDSASCHTAKGSSEVCQPRIKMSGCRTDPHLETSDPNIAQVTASSGVQSEFLHSISAQVSRNTIIFHRIEPANGSAVKSSDFTFPFFEYPPTIGSHQLLILICGWHGNHTCLERILTMIMHLHGVNSSKRMSISVIFHVFFAAVGNTLFILCRMPSLDCLPMLKPFADTKGKSRLVFTDCARQRLAVNCSSDTCAAPGKPTPNLGRSPSPYRCT